MKSLTACPMSCAAYPSPFFASSRDRLHCYSNPSHALCGQRHTIVACRTFYGNSDIVEPSSRTLGPSKCKPTVRSRRRPVKINRHSWNVCMSSGRDLKHSSLNDHGDNDSEPFRGRYDVVDIFNRKPTPVQHGYDVSVDFYREPTPSRRDFSAREISNRFRSSNYVEHTGGRTLNAEVPDSNYVVPLGHVREYPVRADRLYEAVSKINMGDMIQKNLELSDHEGFIGCENDTMDRTFSPFKNSTVSVFWDLDNKPPKSSPYHTALYLRHAASQFGDVMEIVAYANYHAFTHVPEWVREQRRERKQLNMLEQRGLVQPEKPYVCSLCGRKCKTNLLLKKHFKQLHEREHNKRMNRLNALKGKKKLKYREALSPKLERYKEAASPILVPKVGYGLESDLRRAGIFVKTVQYKPQAADIELKKQMVNSMHKGVKCICLVSDDTDFSSMLVDARALNLCTVVFGESRSLKRYADFWFPWGDVSQGLPAEDIQDAIRSWMLHQNSAQHRGLSRISVKQNDGDHVDVIHKIFGGKAPEQKAGLSMFADEETVDAQDEDSSSSEGETEWDFDDESDELDDVWMDDEVV